VVDSEGDSFKIDHDPAILDRARRQHGHVARWQLLELGVSQGLIQGRVETGKWVAVHTGVYCIGPRRADPVSRAAAAVLAWGPGAALSHASAGSLWGFLPRWSGPMEVTTKAKRARPGITTHRCQSFKPRDVTRQHGVPTTTRARTALDIAPRLSHKHLTRMVNDARRDGHLRNDALNDIITRNPLHPGAKLLKPFAETTTNPTNSAFEDDFLAFTEKYNLPTPLINTIVNGYEVDAYFPDHNLIVECDGYEYHKDRTAFESDRERDAHHLAHGTPTVRLTRERLTHTPDREANRLHTILSRTLDAKPDAKPTAYPKRPVT
jgi:hypothetical protein